MSSNKPKKEMMKSEPHPGHAPDVRDDEGAKEPPGNVDGKIGIEGWGPNTITDRIVEETEDAQDPPEAQPD
jgi:hypothetical protein